MPESESAGLGSKKIHKFAINAVIDYFCITKSHLYPKI